MYISHIHVWLCYTYSFFIWLFRFFRCLSFYSFYSEHSLLFIQSILLFDSLQVFIKTLAGVSSGLSQEVFSGFQDSSQYYGRSQHCCSLGRLHPSRYFQVPQSLYQCFGDCTKSTNYNWYNRHFHVPQFFNSLARSRYLSLFSLSFNFTLRSAGTAKFSFYC